MGAERDMPTGVEVRGEAVRIVFRWRGKRYRETLPWASSAGGIARAAALRKRIVGEIRHGTFVYADHFPNSRHASANGLTFSEAAQRYIDWRSRDRGWSESYRSEIARTLNRYWLPALWNRPVDQVTAAEVRAAADAITAGPKTYNNALSALHGVFRLAVQDGLITRDPSAALTARHSAQAREADPFTPAEVGAILAHVRAKHGQVWWAWFAFAFWTGCRPSEQRALRWEDVGEDVAAIRRATVRRKAQERTKTRRNRTIRLSPIAREAITVMRGESLLAGGTVFIHPTSRMQFKDSETADVIWRSTLKALRLRYRSPYQTRHTYASICLTAGMAPKFVASQLGHSLAILERHYGKWLIDTDATDAQMRMLEALAK